MTYAKQKYSKDIDNLIKKVLEGDHNSFTDIAIDYSAEINDLVRSMHPDTSSVEDIVQEVLFITFNKLSAYKSGTHFIRWVRSIARNVCNNKRREWYRRRNNEQRYTEEILGSHKTPEIIRTEILCEEIKKKINNLDPMYKEVLKHFYYQNKCVKEISKLQGVSENQVRVRLFRGRKLIENELKKKYYK